MSEAAKKRTVLVRLKLPRGRRIRGHLVGSIAGRDERGVLVDYAGNPHGPLVARTTVPLNDLAIDAAAATGREVLLVFEHERSDQPLIVGLLEPAPQKPAPGADPDSPQPQPVDTLIDGRRVTLDAQDEIVLRCGEASITLRRNGRVVIRGAYVETRSRGVNRVKGGSVQIN